MIVAPQSLRSIPILASLNIQRSMDFFVTQLGFQHVARYDDHGYGIVARDQAELHFWSCSDRSVVDVTACYVRVGDVDALYREWQPRGIRRLDPPVDRPWGMRELYVFDPDGSLVKFGQPVCVASSARTASPPHLRGAVIYAKDLDEVSRFYVNGLGMSVSERQPDHIVLSGESTELVLVRIPAGIAGEIRIAKPPLPRAATPIKLVFRVASIDGLRRSIVASGGSVNAQETMWNFGNDRVCDAFDPEGNIFQLRECLQAQER